MGDGWFDAEVMDEEFIMDLAALSREFSFMKMFYGDIILKCLGYNAGCIDIRRLRSADVPSVNILYATYDGEEYIRTFVVKEIVESLKGKIVDYSYDVRDEEA